METFEFPTPARDARTVVITGGGRGIGRACAMRFASLGFKVGVLARSLDEVDAVAGAIHVGGGMATSAVCDVSSEASVKDAIASCNKRLGEADVVVNNAGQATSVPFVKMSLEKWKRMLDVNLTGTFLVTREVLPGMLTRGWGRVINIASTAGLSGARYTSHYCASKHGVVGLTRALGLEVAGKGVTVNAVCPGWVQTDMLDATLKNIVSKTGRSDEEAAAALLRDIPTGRFVSPESVAALVTFVASDAAADITGAALTIDGGQLA